MPTTSATALVIGGGIIGRNCALALQRRGWTVTLVDDDATGNAASWGNAGHIATEQIEPLASLATLRSAPGNLHVFGGPLDLREPWRHLPWIAAWLRACAPARFESGRKALRSLLAEALPAWRRLASSLGDPGLLLEHGHWMCWESRASAGHGRGSWTTKDIGNARAFDLPANALAQLHEAAPAARIHGGIGFDGTAQISDPVLLAERLASRFVEHGGTLLHATVQRLDREGRRARAVTRTGEVLDADQIVVCAGVASRPLMESIGVNAPLIAERGYHLQWTQHDWPDIPPVVFEDRSMIVTRFSGGLRVAGCVEYARPDAAPDPGKWARLARHASELALPVQGQPSRWFGARPTLPDYLPALGRCKRFDNLAYAFGHQHLGLTLAAISGELVADACAQRDGAVSLAPFDLQRFS